MALIYRLNLRGDESILDIGCGNGRITASLAELVPSGRVVGVDISPEMVEFARGKYPSAKYPHLSFQLKDASRLDFYEEFDIAVSFACLHWIRDHLPVLHGVYNALVPGGRIIFQCGGKGNAAELLGVTEELIRVKAWSEFFHDASSPYCFYEPDEYGEWLVQAGLRPLQVELIPKDMVQEGRAGLEEFIGATWLPYLERLPDSRRQEFVKQIAQRYIEGHPLDEDGRVHVKMMRLQVAAERPVKSWRLDITSQKPS
jgi:trans-aconitate methyltransferase